jgi:hypothetical protein
MANTLDQITTARIMYGRELLSQLRAKLFMGMTVSRRFSPIGARPFGTLRVPNVVVPAAVVRAKGTALTWADTSISYVDVNLNQHIIVPMVLDTLDAVISDIDFRVQMAVRAAYNIAAFIEGLLAGLYIYVGQFVGTVAGAAFATLANAQAAVQLLDTALAPDSPRFGALSPSAKSSALGNTSFTSWTVAGPESTLVAGTLGERLGIQWGMTQAIKQQGAGVDGTSAWGTPTVTGINAIGTTSVLLGGLAASGALKAGDAFILGGNYYSVTADVTASGSAATVVISPPLKAATTAGQAITIGEGVKRGWNNLIYVPEAFALAVAPMDDMRPGTDSNVIVDEQTGLGIRVTYSWDHSNMRHLFTTELLAGVACVRPDLAVRLIANG